MSLSLTQTATVRVTANQAITNNLLRQLALSPSTSISGSVAAADLATGAVTPIKTSPGAYFYGALSGTNAYTLSLSPTLSAYANGVEVLGKVGNANTAAAVATLNVDTLGAKNIYHGATGELIKAGDLPANALVHFVYNTTRNGGAGGWDVREVIPSSMIRPATNVTTGTANAQAVVNTPPITAYAEGMFLLVKIGSGLTNTAAATLASDGLTARTIKRADGTDLLNGDLKEGRTYLLYDDGTNYVLLTRQPDVAVVGTGRNIIIANNSGTPNSKMDITADELVLKTSDGSSYLASSVSVTADIALGVAANGLDAGVEASDTWYYLWVIYNGTTVSALISTSATSPTLPTGYTHRALVGQVRNNASSNFTVTRIVDRRVWVANQDIAATIDGVTSYTVLSGTPATTFATIVPPNARAAQIILGRLSNNNIQVGVALDSTGTGEEIFQLVGTATAWNGMNAVGTMMVPVISQTFYWKVGETASTNDYKMQCSGYTF